MKHVRRTGISIGVLFIATLCAADVANAQFEDVEIVPAFEHLTFDAPVDIQHPSDGTDRLFVVEKSGIIRVFENDAAADEAGVFLDIQDRVDDAGFEMGLLGLVFHPDYETNGLFFVNYTAGGPRRTVVARYEVDPSDLNAADKESETIILEVDQPYANHNAGQLQFGPDGYLYIGMGDGGSGGDPEENGQDVTTLLGSLLRIDVDEPAEDRHYSVPTDNPLVRALCGPAPCATEIWAWGLRNPWRFSFDPQTGELWLADVGQGSWEEVDVIEKGGNYGWDVMEGEHCFEPSSGCDMSGLILPVWEYSHSLGNSVTGGYVYRGSDVPELEGHYVFGDYGSGRIWVLDVGDVDAGATELMNSDLTITTFGVDAQGELYVSHYGTGEIYKFVSSGGTDVEKHEVPASFARLKPVRPNPFWDDATLIFELDRPAHAELVIYDARGRQMRMLVSAMKEAGPHEVAWDGRTSGGERVAAGVYLARLIVDGVPVASERMVRLSP